MPVRRNGRGMKNEDTKILLAAKISFSISDMIVAILRITKIQIYGINPILNEAC
jgi:hypothetical protein